MAFADDFAAALATRSINVDASGLPDRDTIQQELSNIQVWLSDLDGDIREGLDEASAEFTVCHVISDPETDENGEVIGVNVAPNLSALMGAFDQTSGQRLSEMLRSSQDAFAEADAVV
ncbi:hypothetical protein [Nocardia sp. R7R-8]|uniref:hypothetical protein n=1 Tax=Nocardia sp. R7R-8 TaxID=3459304 RepID=UPI00403D74A7